MIPWEIEADQLVSCNCAYGCPCQFNAPPTNGRCEGIGAFVIRRGYFGSTTLDGLRMISVSAWPGPVHEGRGRCLHIVDERADAAQRGALLAMMRGEETTPGATMWFVFASTMETVYDPVFAPIETELDVETRMARVFVPGHVDCTGSPIRNPVTGAEHRARIELPNGFEFTVAEMGSSNLRTSGPIELAFDNAYGQFAHIHLNNHGVVGRKDS